MWYVMFYGCFLFVLFKMLWQTDLSQNSIHAIAQCIWQLTITDRKTKPFSYTIVENIAYLGHQFCDRWTYNENCEIRHQLKNITNQISVSPDSHKIFMQCCVASIIKSNTKQDTGFLAKGFWAVKRVFPQFDKILIEKNIFAQNWCLRTATT